MSAEGARVVVLLAAGLVGRHLTEFIELNGQYSTDLRLELHLAAMETVAVDVVAIPPELTAISLLAAPEGIARVAIHIKEDCVLSGAVKRFCGLHSEFLGVNLRSQVLGAS